MTAPEGSAPAVHRIDRVGEAAASIFADTVNALLPGVAGRDLTANGTALVSSKHYGVDVERIKHRRRLIGSAVGVTALNLALALILVLSGNGWYTVLFLPVSIVGALLAARVYLLLPGTVRLWRLPRHGITVDAVYSHIDDKSRAVYIYVDVNGDQRMFMAGLLLPRMGVERISVSYDARNPRNVVRTVDNGRGFALFTLVATGLFALVFLAVAITGALATALL